MCPASALFGTIAESIPEAVLVFAPEGRLAALNMAASALTGLGPAAIGEVTLAELLEDPALAPTILAVASTESLNGKLSLQSLRLYVPAGTQAPFRCECWRIAANGQARVAVRLFVSETEQHRRIVARIAAGLMELRALPAPECQAASLATAITEVCTFTGWVYAETWLPAGRDPAPAAPGWDAAATERWVPHAFWYGDRARYGAFRDFSVKAGMTAPLPLVSRVARDQTASWYSDVSVVPLAVYRRARAAREAGLRATFAQPIVENGQTLAVLIFMMAEVRARDDMLTALMAAVAHRLTPLFRGTHPQLPRTEPPAQPSRGQPAGPESSQPAPQSAESETPAALEPLCRVLESLGKAAFIVAREGRVIAWANAAACAIFGYEREALIGQSTMKLHVDMPAFEEFGRRAQPLIAAGKPFRGRSSMRRSDGARFATEHLVIPLGDVEGRSYSVSLLSDLGEVAKLTFGRRLEQLSAREQEVLQLTIAGETVNEMAERLGLSVRTVEAHRSNMLHKLGCASTTKLLTELLADSVAEKDRL